MESNKSKVISLHNLSFIPGSLKKKKKRLGRGEGSNKGGTSGKGHKGQKSRSGYSKKNGFEGGQMPLQRRVPKLGFKNFNRKEYVIINLDTIQFLVDNEKIKKEAHLKEFHENGLSPHFGDKIKILAKGAANFKSKLNISAHKVSKKAREAIEKNQGTLIILK